jgi:hypothetical protein
MSLGIRSPKVDAFARELASAAGEDIDTSVECAIKERLARFPRRLPAERQAELDALSDRLTRLPVGDQRSSDEILGCGPDGLAG